MVSCNNSSASAWLNVSRCARRDKESIRGSASRAKRAAKSPPVSRLLVMSTGQGGEVAGEPVGVASGVNRRGAAGQQHVLVQLRAEKPCLRLRPDTTSVVVRAQMCAQK